MKKTVPINPPFPQNPVRSKSTQVFERFTVRNVAIGLIVLALYISWVVLAVGWRGDHLFLLSLCTLSYYGTATSRKLFLGFLFILLYWILYDSMRVYPNYLVNPIHIIEPYEIEKAWFGIQTSAGLITPNEFFENYQIAWLDVLSALFYLCWVPVPLMYAIWLFFNDKALLAEFTMAFFLVNVLGIIVYYLYPAAPPWYVETYGFELHFDTPGSAAGLLRFDEIMGVSLFSGMYEKNANVFAAIPSLHAAFPVILLYYSVKKRLKYASLLFLIILVGIWFAAVYTRHHYIIDVLLGGAIAVLAIVLFEALLRFPGFKKWHKKYVRLIS